MATAEIEAAIRSAAVAGDPLLEALRRLMRLGDGAGEVEEVHAALAHELFALPGADEVHVHHLRGAARWELEGVGGGPAHHVRGSARWELGGAVGGRDRVPLGAPAGEPVEVRLFGGDGLLRYVLPRAERPPGVAWVASTGQPLLAAGPRELAGAVPRLAAAGEEGCALLVPLAVRGEVEAVVVLVRRRPEEPFDALAVQRAAALVDQAAAALALLRARADAGTDAVTGCMNHRAMRLRLREEIGRVARTGGRLACLLLDLDDFKLVNDRHGHPVGDALLRGVGRALQGEFRAFDRVARYGGDEFVAILPAADLHAAAQAATRALARLAAIRVPGLDAGVRASVGVAQWAPGMTAEELLAACDEALLRGKRVGKGRVELAL